MRSVREALTHLVERPSQCAGHRHHRVLAVRLGLFGLVAINIRRALEQVEERVEVRAFVSDDAEIEAVAAAMKDVGEFPEVRRVTTYRRKGVERARKEMGEFADVFEAGVLPHRRSSPAAGDAKPTIVKSVLTVSGRISFIDDVRYGEEGWKTLSPAQHRYRRRHRARRRLAAVAVIIIGATIRMTVLARAKEISIMRLVGATDMFHPLPFLIDGLVKGVGRAAGAAVRMGGQPGDQ